MAKINTVHGPISPEELGVTLVHEHIYAGYPGWDCDPLSRPYNREKLVKIILPVIEPAKAYGLKSMIDATPLDLNRDVDIMKEISEKLQINVIFSTGRYSEESGKWIYLKVRSKLKIADMCTELYEGFMQEITKGVGSSGVKPGVIKIGTSHNSITPLEEALFRAAARASKETGLPIITHTEDGTMGPEQADLLIGEGANPNHIMIGHMDFNPSLQYQLNTLSRGVNIGFDRVGLEQVVSDKVRIAMLVGLLGVGYTDRIMLSHDFTCSAAGRGGKPPAEVLQISPNASFTNIFRIILPALKQAGITDAQIKSLMVINPRRLFEGN